MESCHALSLNSQVALVAQLIGKGEGHEATEKKLIEELIAKDEIKACDGLCTKFGVSIDEYPQLVNYKKTGSVRYHANQYLKKKKSDWQFRGLNRVEEVFKGLPEYLVKLCEILVHEERMDEAKGVYTRNNLTVVDFEKAFVDIKEMGEFIQNHVYDKSKDYQPKEDMFEPTTEPH